MMPEDSEHLFVYGTLRQGEIMHPVLASRSAYVGAGRIQGRLYEVAHYPGVLPSRNPSEWVRGELYRLHDPPGTLARLDAYEGCDPSAENGALFVRRICPVILDAGESAQSWIYYYNRSVTGLRWIVSGDYCRREY